MINNREYQTSLRIMQLASPYFLSKYQNGSLGDIQKRQINGVWYKVERFNHGLAHALRQGALAKDILDILARMPIESGDLQIDTFLRWTRQKHLEGQPFLAKLEMAASFQRSGRQSEVSSSSNPTLYKEYEWQDTINFKKAANTSKLFKNDSEMELFKEALLWSNQGILDENKYPDLKYLRCILRAAHTLDLRRIIAFDAGKIKKDFLDQLFNHRAERLPLAISKKLTNTLWERSGKYLQATGDRDVVSKRWLTDIFFLQSQKPEMIVQAIDQVRLVGA